jgi:hypothetical protein
MIVIIVLKPDSGVDLGQARVMGQDGHLGLAWDNIRIKMIIIIVLKLVLVVEPREGMGWVTNREG